MVLRLEAVVGVGGRPRRGVKEEGVNVDGEEAVPGVQGVEDEKDEPDEVVAPVETAGVGVSASLPLRLLPPLTLKELGVTSESTLT